MAPAGFYDDPPATSRPLTAADLEGLGQGAGLGPGMGGGPGLGPGEGLGEEDGWGEEEQNGPGLSSSSRKSREHDGNERESGRGNVMDDNDNDGGGGGRGVNPMGAGTIVGDDGMPILPNESTADMGIDTIPSPSNDKGRGGKDNGKGKGRGGGVTSLLSSLLTRNTTTSPPKIHIPFFSKPTNKGSDAANPQDNGSKREGEEVGEEGMSPVPSHDTAPNINRT